METVQPEKHGFSSTRLARIRPVMQRFVDEGKFAGILTVIARKGEVVHCDSVGMMDIEAGRSLQEDNIFRIYSMTKPIASTAVMMLYEEGCFRLSDPVSEFLPEFKDVQVAESGADGKMKLVPPVRPITIHDLLTHTAGLCYGWDENDPADKLFRETMEPLWGLRGPNALRDFTRAIASVPLRHQPGQLFHYSAAIDVLGRLVEVVAGMPLGDFLRQRIFEPLGMVDTSFFVPAEKVDRFAHMYGPVEENGAGAPSKLKDIDPLESSSYLLPDRLQGGGGGLTSTAWDYLRFCQMILNGGELDGARLLGRKTVDLMRMNHLPEGKYQADNPAHGFGLGGYVLLDLAKASSNGSVGNWGWGGAANTFFWIDFQEQIIPVIMIQHMPFQPYPIEDIFKNLVYQAMI
jgi:CubicO group peptidase (beta-lactamase class C family)